MQRLTKQYPSGKITLDTEQFPYNQETIDNEINAFEPFKRVVKRLFEYEKSGLTPDEVDDLCFTLTGVMHNVDKFLNEDELKQDPVNRASDMRSKVLKLIEGKENKNGRH